MQVSISNVFECPAEKVIAEAMTSKLMVAVCEPLVRFEPIHPDTLPEIWKPGDYIVKMYLFGRIYLGKHTIRISYPKPSSQDTFLLRDEGGGQLVRTWDHLITIQSVDAEHTLYKDEIRIETGLGTFFVWLFAKYYYRSRQRRWKKLIKNNFDYSRLE